MRLIIHHDFTNDFKNLYIRIRILFLKFGQRAGLWKNCSEIGGLSERGGGGGGGGGGGFQIVSSVFREKSMFSLLLEYFFLFGKYSHLM